MIAQNQDSPLIRDGTDGIHQIPMNLPSFTSSKYGIRRIDRKRRENKLINFRIEQKRILDQILGKGEYDPRIRPAGIYNNTGNI